MTAFSRRYTAKLRTHLQAGAGAGLKAAVDLGHGAVRLGLETPKLKQLHLAALAALGSTDGGSIRVRKARSFFAAANAPLAQARAAARQSASRLNGMHAMLKERSVDLAAANRRLKKDVSRRKHVEASLKKSGQHYARLLKESLGLQEELRQMTRQVMAAQEEERRIISRELQDEVGQTLLGINARLMALRRQAQKNVEGLKDEISATQRLVGTTARFTVCGAPGARKA